MKFEQRLAYDGRNGNIPDEFVETKYYDDLNCVDKQHHTVFSSPSIIDYDLCLCVCARALTKKMNFAFRQEQDS